jgi:hypothetical protein
LVRTENGKEFRRNRRHLLCRVPVMPGTHGPAKTCAESARGQQAAKSKRHSNSSRTASTSTIRWIGPTTTSPSHPLKTTQEHTAHPPATQAILPQNGLTPTISTPCRGNKLEKTPMKKLPPHPIQIIIKRTCDKV